MIVSTTWCLFIAGEQVRGLASQLALICEQNCTKLKDFTGEQGDPIALDIVCGSGGTSFELAQR